MLDEIDSMKAAGFISAKIVEKTSEQIIGLLDFTLDDEIYLSLLMIHKNYSSKGFGQQVCQALECYAKLTGSSSIRLDVVTGYTNRVLNFWIAVGYDVVEECVLSWHAVSLPAVTMKKAFPVIGTRK